MAEYGINGIQVSNLIWSPDIIQVSNWTAATTACPAEWRLPSANELANLINLTTYINGTDGYDWGDYTITRYNGPDGNGLVVYNKDDTTQYLNFGADALYLSSSSASSTAAWAMHVAPTRQQGYMNHFSKSSAARIRCVTNVK